MKPAFHLRKHVNRFFLFTFLLLLLGITARVSWTMLAASDWPMFRGDAQHTGLSANTGPQPTPGILWSYDTGSDQPILSSPSIGPDDTIYFGTLPYVDQGLVPHDGAVYAVNSDGTLKWSTPVGEVISSPALGAVTVDYPDGVLYVGTVSGSALIPGPSVVKLDAANGDLLGYYSTPDPVFSSAVIHPSGDIIVGTGFLGSGVGSVISLAPGSFDSTLR